MSTHKKIFMGMVVCAYLALSGTAGHCQDYGSSDSSIEQSESQMGDKLESEISSGQDEGQAEMDRANEEMDTGTSIE